MSTPKDTVEDWEKEFDTLCEKGFADNRYTGTANYSRLKIYIRTLLHATEARVRRDILTKDIEELEEMKTGKGKPAGLLSDEDFINNTVLHTIITSKKKALQAITPTS